MTADTEGDMTLQHSKYWLIRADFQMESFIRKHVGFIRHEGHYKLSHDVSHWLLKSCVEWYSPLLRLETRRRWSSKDWKDLGSLETGSLDNGGS